jgi:hypothetical protein
MRAVARGRRRAGSRPATRNTVEAKIKEATLLCNSDKYSEGYTVTAKLARFIGHLEARKGIAPVL